jgi:nitrogen fixation/metabolism regulation signal transduction histidine kinase
VDGSTIPVSDSESGSFTLNSLGGRQGFFIGVYFSTNLSMYGLGTMHGVAIVDRTAELADIENFFADQRNSQVMGMSIAAIVALVLTILLTTLGLRYFTNKYVVKPIRELNQTAEAIIDGTFEGQVEVDRDSAYYALQGLLESGQKVLRHVDEKMLDQEE